MVAVAMLLLASCATAQISQQACGNLQSVFTAWGFSTRTQSSVNPYWTNCGCSFVVDIPTGSQAAANCVLSNVTDPLWTVYSLTVSNPPITLGSFPPVLVLLQGNSDGFQWLKSITCTNNALRGNALAGGQLLPSRTSVIDVSNNPTLAMWPGLDANGNPPGYSFQQVTQNGNPHICCPKTSVGNIPACFPSAGVPVCSGPMDLSITPNIANTPANNNLPVADPSSNSSESTSTTAVANGGGASDAGASDTGNIGSASGGKKLSSTAVVLISVAAVVVVAIVGFGGFARYMRTRQKPVLVVDEDWEKANDDVDSGHVDGVVAVAAAEASEFQQQRDRGRGGNSSENVGGRAAHHDARRSIDSQRNSFVASRKNDGTWMVSRN